MPPAFDSDFTWKEMVLIPALILALFVGGHAYLNWRDPSRDLERAHLYRVAFSNLAIRSITGGTTNASFALIPKDERRFIGQSVPEDWKRVKKGDTIQGIARMLIFGKGGGGIFTITYRYVPSSDSFVVLQIKDLDRNLLDEGPLQTPPLTPST